MPGDNRRERKKREAKEKIEKAALRLFTAKGVSDTTVSEIMEEADLGTGTFYNYFESKEDLVANLVQIKILGAKEKFEEILRSPLNAVQKIEKVFLVAGGVFEEYKPLVGYFSQYRKAAPAVKVPLDHGEIFKGMLLQVIEDGQKSGQIKKEITPEALLELLHALLESSVIRRKGQIHLTEDITRKLYIIFNGIMSEGGNNNAN